MDILRTLQNGKVFKDDFNSYYHLFQLYDLENELFVRVYTGHSSWLTSVGFGPSCNTLVTSSADGNCNVSNF